MYMKVKVHPKFISLLQELMFEYCVECSQQTQLFFVDDDSDESFVFHQALLQYVSNLRSKPQVAQISIQQFQTMIISHTPENHYFLFPYSACSLSSFFLQSLFENHPLNIEVKNFIFPFSNVPESLIIQQLNLNLKSRQFLPFISEFLQTTNQINRMSYTNFSRAIRFLQKQRISFPSYLNESQNLISSIKTIQSILLNQLSSKYIKLEEMIQIMRNIINHFVIPKSVITVAFSGGKDSFVLSLLLIVSKFVFDLDFEIKLATFDPKLPGFEVLKIVQVAEVLKQTLQKLGVPVLFDHEIIEKDLNELAKQQSSLCPICASNRRKQLSNFCSQQSKNSYLALGHHLSDFFETLLMTGLQNGAMFGLRFCFESGVKVFRPMLLFSQRCVLSVIQELGLELNNFVSSDAAECNLRVETEKVSERGRFRALLSRFELKIDGFEDFLFHNLAKEVAGDIEEL